MELNVLNVAKVIMGLVGKKKSVSSVRLSNIIFLLWCQCKIYNIDFEATFISHHKINTLCKELQMYNSNDFLCYDDFKSVQLTKDDMIFRDLYRKKIKFYLDDDVSILNLSLYTNEGNIIDKYIARRYVLYDIIFPDFNYFSINDMYDDDGSERYFYIYDELKKRFNVLESCINLSNDIMYGILNNYALNKYVTIFTAAEKVVACSRELSNISLYKKGRKYLESSGYFEYDKTVFLRVTDEDIKRAGRIIPKYDVLKEVIHDSRVLLYAMKS